MNKLVTVVFVSLALNFFVDSVHVVAQEVPLSLPLTSTFTPHQYGGGIQNWDIAQDSTSFIYVANNYGLLEFDGIRWSKYRHKNQTKIRCLYIEPKTNWIYVGGQNQFGYFHKTVTTMQYVDLKKRLPKDIRTDEVWRIFQFKNQLFVNLYEDLVFIRNDTVTTVPSKLKVDFAFPVDEDIYAFSKDGFLLKLNPSGALEKITQKTLPERIIMGLSLHGETYFFTYEGGIYKLKGSTLLRQNYSVTHLLKNAKVNCVIKLKTDNLALGTQNDGVILLNASFEPIGHFTKNRGLNHRTVLSLYEDSFNDLWVGLNKGLEVVEIASPFSQINEDLGVEGTGYSAAMVGNSVYLATGAGLFVKTNDELFGLDADYQLVAGSEGLVNNLAVIDNELIVCHHEGAFIVTKNGRLQKFFPIGSWDFKTIGKNKILGGAYDGLYLFSRGKEGWILDQKIEDLEESSRIFEFENDSTIWMTHGYKGAYRVELNTELSRTKNVRKYGKASGFPSDILINVYKLQNEMVFTGEKSAFTYDAARNNFKPHQFLNDWFEDKHISKFQFSSPNTLFYISDGQLGFLREKNLGNYVSEINSFQRVNNVLNNDLENINILPNGKVLIGAEEGFILFDESKNKGYVEEFRVYIQEIYWTDPHDLEHKSNVNFLDNLELLSPRSLRFIFSVPFYDGIENLQFSYRLFPYEQEWSDWTTIGWKEYTLVPIGLYDFQLKGKNTFGETSKVVNIPLEILPMWYNSPVFYMIVAFIVLFFLVFVFFGREKSFKKKTKAIVQSSQAEIEEKEQKISDYSKQKAEEIELIKNQSLQSELEFKNKQLATVTMHLLAKNEFVRSVRKKLFEALNHLIRKEEISKIIKTIDKNIEENDGWETFTYHFDQVHGNFLKNIREQVKLTNQETKLCAYLKLNMSTKDIASLMNITVRSVELARYRLRKKLDLNRNESLTDYLSRF